VVGAVEVVVPGLVVVVGGTVVEVVVVVGGTVVVEAVVVVVVVGGTTVGLNLSALAVAPAPPWVEEPPATSTSPSGRGLAANNWRGVAMAAVATQALVAGS